ncbi:glycoside hydrolase family 43 protein [Mesobacterium pallidum]|uniref:glycoside hydrolase family 43 protein n=1 Tax=Mesobacterium pallidum TaxID=2872037 RepID=UPI001EE1AC20|nr:glycoside hydrolase family 43 protein [Mesobacterium pallidum]
MIRNPILPGFNPDPSICRVGDEYFIATSTFEWYPGVQIHRSTDLVNWDLVARPLNRASQLDMRGNPDSCGIWAPCLSHDGEKFWLVYTDVKRNEGNFKDAHNYIVTCDTIDGDWSDPTFVSSHGFDPSLFHDDNGRKYWLVLRWNHISNSVGGNPKHRAFDGILCQEWSERDGLIGPIKVISHGSKLGLTEGPHLSKRDGWYYLTVAEGGTGYDHAVTMARSRDIWGPYALHPDTHLITAKDAPDAPLQRAGHGQIVETPDGRTYHTHLCSRPLPGLEKRFSPLGRETAIQECEWRDDGWLYAKHGPVPQVEVPGLTDAQPRPTRPVCRTFNTRTLPPEFQWLRTPQPERLFTLTGKALRLTGRESVGSWFEQSLVARRQEHLSYRAETVVDFRPQSYQQMAGLTTYYNRHKFHFAGVTKHPEAGLSLFILSCPGMWPDGQMSYPMQPRPINEGPVDLAVIVTGATQQFWWRQGQDWNPLGPELDAAVISDEGGRGEHGSFTGAFVGMLCFDTTGLGRTADFARFDYHPVGA